MMKDKPIIAVDVDDVLSFTAQSIIEFSNRFHGTSLTIAEFNESFPVMWDVSKEESERMWAPYIEGGEIAKVQPNPDAVPVLKRLSHRYRLIPLTSRRDNLHGLTQAWVSKYMGDVLEPVEMMGINWARDVHASKITKADRLVSMGAEYLIDDQLKHCLATAETGKRAVLFGDYPWNEAEELPANVTRCKDWAAVAAYFDNLTLGP